MTAKPIIAYNCEEERKVETPCCPVERGGSGQAAYRTTVTPQLGGQSRAGEIWKVRSLKMCKTIRCAVAGEPVPKQRSLALDERSSGVCNQEMNEGRRTREECGVRSNDNPRRARPVQERFRRAQYINSETISGISESKARRKHQRARLRPSSAPRAQAPARR